MNADTNKVIVVTGATGRQGGAVARALLQDGWHVRALTRNAASDKARALLALGADVVQGNMDDQEFLRRLFRDAYGAFSVQNPMISGLEAEVRQGKLVADAAKEANISHLVYGSAGFGKPTGVGSWDSKAQIEAHIEAQEIPATILRPTAFMELMTDKDFYPPVSTWHLMPKFMGLATPVGWLSAGDLGRIAAKVFASPDKFIGQELQLASDVKSIDECKAIYSEVTGKKAPRFPMPVWLFKRFVGSDLIDMWQWLKAAKIEFETASTRVLHPEAATIDGWLRDWKRSRETAN
jgi:uncharacterized protein YbjT (DUF2867 family)